MVQFTALLELRSSQLEVSLGPRLPYLLPQCAAAQQRLLASIVVYCQVVMYYFKLVLFKQSPKNTYAQKYKLASAKATASIWPTASQRQPEKMRLDLCMLPDSRGHRVCVLLCSAALAAPASADRLVAVVSTRPDTAPSVRGSLNDMYQGGPSRPFLAKALSTV